MYEYIVYILRWDWHGWCDGWSSAWAIVLFILWILTRMPWERESAYGERDRTAPIYIITFTAVTPFQGEKGNLKQGKNEWKEKEKYDENCNQMA